MRDFTARWVCAACALWAFMGSARAQAPAEERLAGAETPAAEAETPGAESPEGPATPAEARHADAAVEVQHAILLQEVHPAVLPYERPPSGLTAFELTAGLGVLGRATSGTPLVGHGYDASPGPLVDVTTRWLFGSNRYLRFGLHARALHQRGRGFGRQGFGFASTVGDLALTARTMFPCMSSPKRQVWFALNLGLSGGYHDAGTGRGPMTENTDPNARRAAAETLDHGALGYVVGVDLSLQFGALLVGLSADVRQHFALGAVDVRSHFLPSAALRVGYAFNRLR
ncbi:MAG: hypothetical protein KF901_22825 [Myxococcales bacterium]|nr:hypothetical protein [Myxococcales bacterium]